MRRFCIVIALTLASVTGAACADDETGETVTLKTQNQEAFSVYRVGPRGARYGILLIHESWGLSENVRDWADWLGRNGYRVVAVDLYDGRIAQGREQAQTYKAAVKQASANAKYRAAAGLLRAPGRKLVAMGWEFGGTQALHAAIALPNTIAAAVVYDGALISDSAVLSQLRVPVLGVFAKDGSTAAPDKVRAFEADMKRLKRPVAVHYYEREPIEAEGHFYNGTVAQRVWDPTTAFFKKYLK